MLAKFSVKIYQAFSLFFSEAVIYKEYVEVSCFATNEAFKEIGPLEYNQLYIRDV